MELNVSWAKTKMHSFVGLLDDTVHAQCMPVHTVKPHTCRKSEVLDKWKFQILGVYSESFTCNFIQPNMFTQVTYTQKCPALRKCLVYVSHANLIIQKRTHTFFNVQFVLYFTCLFNQEWIRKSNTIRPLQT